MKPILDKLEATFGTYVIPKRIIYESKSKHQRIVLFENEKYGRVLFLDKAFQTSEYDEYMYHEPLVHPAMCLHPNPEKVLVIGGGDGGALEEVLKHNIVKRAVLVELDEEVVKVSKKYLSSINRGAFDDERVDVVIDDGVKYLKKVNERFDVIILDLTDPYSVSAYLYTDDFYRLIKKRLADGGLLSLHVEMPFALDRLHLRIVKTLKTVFKHVWVYYNFVPIYGTVMGFAVCSDTVDPTKVKTEKIEKRLEERGIGNLRLYCPDVHRMFMIMSHLVENRIKNSNVRIITKRSSVRDYEKL